ncbi:class I SAM-dependent methyltransferase [Fulvimarina sp. MAC3]|uniref:class I SAM-dependent methyltransferase n=1 Tax=Fulvimarina sp. MAC3 TaxID=3148887 RepID=UPI0031FCFFF9
MSGFEADWLTLREPADRRARDAGLLTSAADHLQGASCPVVDLGCGTGSTFRALDPVAAVGRQWVFVDDDPVLLERARAALPEAALDRVTMLKANLADPVDELFASAGLVTASALFDLVSADYIAELAKALRRNAVGLYAALTVDGRIVWEKPHALDDVIAAAFARDQKKDKGFGRGLGGDAAGVLENALRAEGFTVRAAGSDWVLGSDDADLQNAFHAGFAETARGQISNHDIEEWLSFRAEAAREGAALRVGHRDCLAIPAH